MESLVTRLLTPPVLYAAAFLLILAGVRRWRPRTGGEAPDGWRGPSRGERLAALGAGFAVVAAAFVLAAPPSNTAAAEAVRPPWFLAGFAELGRYLEPWAAALLPFLCLGALAALPYLEVPADLDDGRLHPHRREEVLLFLLGVTLLGVLPVVIGVLLRDPAVGSGLPPAQPLSELFWCRWLGLAAPPGLALVRELPGIALLLAYLLVPLRQLTRWRTTRGLFGRYRKGLGARRYTVALVLGLCFLLVFLKVYARWLLGVGALVDLPELALRF